MKIWNCVFAKMSIGRLIVVSLVVVGTLFILSKLVVAILDSNSEPWRKVQIKNDPKRVFRVLEHTVNSEVATNPKKTLSEGYLFVNSNTRVLREWTATLSRKEKANLERLLFHSWGAYKSFNPQKTSRKEFENMLIELDLFRNTDK